MLVLLPNNLFLLPRSVCFLFVFWLSLELHIHLLPCVLDILHAVMDYSWALRKLCLMINQFSWAPLSSGAVSEGILPSRSWNRPKSALGKSRVVILLFVLLIPLRILNSTVQKRLLSTFTYSTSSSVLVYSRCIASSLASYLVFSEKLLSTGCSAPVRRAIPPCLCNPNEVNSAPTHGLLTPPVCSTRSMHLCTGIRAEPQTVLLLQGRCAVPQPHSL